MAPVSPSPASATAPATAFPLPSGWKVPPTVEVAIMFHALVEVVEVSVVVVGANHWNGCYVVLGILLKILQNVKTLSLFFMYPINLTK